MKATIKKMNDANVYYWYYTIERPNHTTIFSNNYRSEKMATNKLNKKLKDLSV